jgi:hypothetical protein
VVTQGPVLNALATQLPLLHELPVWQPLLLVQEMPQAVVEAQMYGAQGMFAGVDCLQVPAPSHEPVVVERVLVVLEQEVVPAQPVPDVA